MRWFGLRSINPKTKRQERQKHHWLWLIVLLMMCGTCYLGAWMFAQYGGHWATRNDLPIPTNSVFLAQTSSIGFADYETRSRLFANSQSPSKLREWFISESANMTPITLSDGSRLEYDGFYGLTPFYAMTSTPHDLYSGVVQMISNKSSDYHLQIILSNCQDIRIYHTNDDAHRDFPGATIPDGYTAFMVRTCWPNVSQ